MSDNDPYPNETWQPTMQLRWWSAGVYGTDQWGRSTPPPQILQQLWVSDCDRRKWRDVEFYYGPRD